MKSRIVKIGNSKGVRIPKALLDQTGLDGEVEIKAEGATLRITRAKRIKNPRAGWAEACQEMMKRGDDKPLDPYVPTKFDEEEWEWK